MRLYTLFLTLIFSPALSAFDLQSLEQPPETRFHWVAQDIHHNGLAMQVLQVESTLPLDSLFDFYHMTWSQTAAQHERSTTRRKAGQWTVLSALLNEHNVALQLQAEPGRTWGYLSATPLGDSPKTSRLAEQFPRQWSTELISSTQSHDGGGLATTVILRNGFSVRSNQDFYQRHFENAGWLLSHSRTDKGTVVLFFDKGQEAIELGLKQEQQHTVVFANLRGEKL